MSDKNSWIKTLFTGWWNFDTVLTDEFREATVQCYPIRSCLVLRRGTSSSLNKKRHKMNVFELRACCWRWVMIGRKIGDFQMLWAALKRFCDLELHRRTSSKVTKLANDSWNHEQYFCNNKMLQKFTTKVERIRGISSCETHFIKNFPQLVKFSSIGAEKYAKKSSSSSSFRYNWRWLFLAFFYESKATPKSNNTKHFWLISIIVFFMNVASSGCGSGGKFIVLR